ncbi:MAG TPA: N-6 DNA methylase [Tepidisphaeraceae bacterium]|jgi:type I restriction-modification system DNA methylase subunit
MAVKKLSCPSLYEQVMEQAGFYRGLRPSAGVYRARDLTTTPKADTGLIDRSFRYAALTDPKLLDVTDIYEWSGNSCIYFKHVRERLSAEKLNERIGAWHRLAWNNGLARMLWVVTPTELRVFNAYERPPEDSRLLGNPAVELFHAVAGDLEQINKELLHRRDIESGAFWDSATGKKIDKDRRVDNALLNDLRLASGNLVAAGLSPSESHRLLLQTIFVAFLEARGFLPVRIFDGMGGAHRFGDVVADAHRTRKFFAAMHEEFDGDLFPPLSEGDDLGTEPLLKPKQLNVIWRILNKTEQTGQQRFWPYDFRAVPIELISSVYEDFLHAQDEQGALEKGVHYTPLNLVDLVLSQTLDRSVPLTAKLLDLSCGSGVFLVDGFRRLVARRVAAGEKLSRRLIREVLFNQVFGIDIRSDAIDVAAFSLCMTALEMEPAHANGIPVRFERPLRGRNLFAEDAFDLKASYNSAPAFKKKQFGVIVGNPPWTSPKGKGSTAPTSHATHMEYCTSRVPPFPLAHDSPPDPAFIRRAEDFAAPKARLGLIVAATRFFSHQKKSRKVKKAVFTRYCPEVVINLSQVFDYVFPSARQPAIVLIARNEPATEHDTFFLYSVEYSTSFKRHGALEINSETARQLPVLDAATEKNALKVAAWGRPRDWSLIGRLSSHRALKHFLKEHGTKAYNGFIKGKESQPTPPAMLGQPLLIKQALRPLRIETDSLKEMELPRLEAPRPLKIYKAPLVLFARSLIKNRAVAAYTRKDLVYSSLFIGIPFPARNDRVARYLNGLLNSSVATYYLFLTSPVWGVERYEVRKAEWMEIPIPK